MSTGKCRSLHTIDFALAVIEFLLDFDRSRPTGFGFIHHWLFLDLKREILNLMMSGCWVDSLLPLICHSASGFFFFGFVCCLFRIRALIQPGDTHGRCSVPIIICGFINWWILTAGQKWWSSTAFFSLDSLDFGTHSSIKFCSGGIMASASSACRSMMWPR